MIKRIILKKIKEKLFRKKAIIIYGARQVGKTTLLKLLSDSIKEKILWLNGDEILVRELLSNANLSNLKRVIGEYKVIFIDEAQRIENIGITIKLIVDNFEDIQVIATGSSSLGLFDKIKEPLTGRKYEFVLNPISLEEIIEHFGYLEALKMRDLLLTYGSYPEIIVKRDEAEELLVQLTDSYLFKDLLIYDGIKKHSLILKILQALALQIGNEVSYNEIAQLIGANKETVEKYIQLLEDCFVIFKLNSLSKNMRNEIKKGKKIYFYDVGIRNALISSFNLPSIRPDIGHLWENFIISERKRFIDNHKINVKKYFWRAVNSREVDYIEEHNGKFYVYEIKWNAKRKSRLPKKLEENYNIKDFKIINPDNYMNFLIKADV